MTAGATADRVDLARNRLREYVRQGRLPMVLLELPSGQSLEISDPMLDLLGRDRATALATAAPDYTGDPESARASLRMLSEGHLDGYRRRARLPRPDGTSVDVVVGVDACDNRGPDRMAVVTVLPAERGPALTEPAAPELVGSAVIGTITTQGLIDRVVSDDTHLLPQPTAEVLGGPLLDLLHPDDAGVVVLLAAHSSARAAAVTGRVRLRSRSGAWIQGQLALQPLARSTPDGPSGFAFSLSPEPTEHAETDVAARFAQASERNAQQLRAASTAAHLSLLAAALENPQISTLTHREREIVTRLLDSQRVPAIARELYLSPSTVRNHLTAVYRKLGVCSQVELLELLRPR